MKEDSGNGAIASTNLDKVPPHPDLTDYYDEKDGKGAYVREAFDTSAPHYDFINKFVSFGRDLTYRSQALERGGLKAGMAFLDVGCGTGVVSSAAKDIVGPTGSVVSLDPSSGMMREGVEQCRIDNPVVGRAEALPFEDNSFDFLCMGYALRHVEDLRPTFQEYQRVLESDGTLLILEMTPPSSSLIFFLMKAHMKFIVPALTWITTRDRKARQLYSYWWDTIEYCVPPATIIEVLGQAGFSDIERHVALSIFSEYRGKARI